MPVCVRVWCVCVPSVLVSVRLGDLAASAPGLGPVTCHTTISTPPHVIHNQTPPQHHHTTTQPHNHTITHTNQTLPTCLQHPLPLCLRTSGLSSLGGSFLGMVKGLASRWSLGGSGRVPGVEGLLGVLGPWLGDEGTLRPPGTVLGFTCSPDFSWTWQKGG